MPEVTILWKPFNWFADQINGLVSIWWQLLLLSRSLPEIISMIDIQKEFKNLGNILVPTRNKKEKDSTDVKNPPRNQSWNQEEENQLVKEWKQLRVGERWQQFSIWNISCLNVRATNISIVYCQQDIKIVRLLFT